MNKKGIMAVEVMWLSMLFVALSFLPSQTPMFRERTYVNKCMDAGETLQACTNRYATLSSSQVVDYIKDDDMSKGNGGNFVNGYML